MTPEFLPHDANSAQDALNANEKVYQNCSRRPLGRFTTKRSPTGTRFATIQLFDAWTSIKGQSTMMTATHSVRPGAGTDRLLGGRALSLSLVVSLSWLVSLNLAHAATKAESRDAPTSPTEVVAEINLADAAPITEDDVAAKIGEPTVHRIGPVTTVTEVSTGVPFPARVDTGATTCSIHYEAIEIEDAADSPNENVGKRVRILIQGPDGEQQWISTKIVDHVTVRTTTDDDQRYEVRLKLRWQDVEKKVRVTLNDREKMKYPLLLGRNFLRGDFLVDVNLDGDE